MMRFTPPLAPGLPGVRGELAPTTYVWSASQRRLPRQIREVALSALAVLGVCCLVAVLAGMVLGVRPLVLRTGSMAPGMPVGTMAFARPVDASQVEVGDVVSVVRDGGRVTHRVVDRRSTDGMTELTLQGDANGTPDPEPVPATRVDRVVLSVPGLGGLIRRFGEPRAQFVVGALTGAALLWTFGPVGPQRRGRWVPAGGHGTTRRPGATS